jgi:hypothetical protein
LTIAVVVAASLTGCVSRHPTKPAFGPADLASVRNQVVRLPGVHTAEVRYNKGTALIGTSDVFVTLHTISKPDLVALQQAVTRIVWLSRIAPLDDIEVTVFADGAGPRPILEDGGTVLDPDVSKKLRAQYGPRPG